MRIFVTGANGFIGKPTVQELLNHGHHVLGLARNEATKEAFLKLGIEPHAGDLDNLDSLKRGAEASDAVIHLAFKRDLMESDVAAACAADMAAIKAMCEAMIDTNKPFIAASGTLGLVPGKGEVATESDDWNRATPFGARCLCADAVLEFAKRGVRGCVMRFAPTVHGAGDWGFIPMYIKGARAGGTAFYVGDGSNKWPATHKNDTAVALRLAVEKGKAGSSYHVIAEEGIAWKDIAAKVGNRLSCSTGSTTAEQLAKHVGFLAHLIALNNNVSSEKTRKELGWTPVQPGLLEDMEANYFN